MHVHAASNDSLLFATLLLEVLLQLMQDGNSSLFLPLFRPFGPPWLFVPPVPALLLYFCLPLHPSWLLLSTVAALLSATATAAVTFTACTLVTGLLS